MKLCLASMLRDNSWLTRCDYSIKRWTEQQDSSMPTVVFPCQVMQPLLMAVRETVYRDTENVCGPWSQLCENMTWKAEGNSLKWWRVRNGVTGSKGMMLLWLLSDLLLKGLGHQECVERASHSIDSTYTCHWWYLFLTFSVPGIKTWQLYCWNQ